MSDKLNTLLNSIDKRLYNNFTSSQPNYFDSRIKQDLPYFHELKKQQVENNFKSTENLYKSNGGFNPSQYNNNDNRAVGNLLGNQTTNLDIRKMLEQEMQPYLFKMKNDLALQMDAYRKEMEEYSTLPTQISSLKTNLIDNSKQCSINHTENSKKMDILSQKNNKLSKQMDEIKNTLYDVARTLSTLEQSNKHLNDKLPEIEYLTSKINNIDLLNKNVQNEMEVNFVKIMNQKTGLMQGYIEQLNKNYEDLHSKINLYALSEQKMQNRLENLELMNNDINTEIAEQKHLFQNVNTKSQQSIDIIDKYSSKVQILEKKIADMTSNLNTFNNNLTTVEIGIASIGSELNKINNSISSTQNDFSQLRTFQQNNQLDTEALNANIKGLEARLEAQTVELQKLSKRDTFELKNYSSLFQKIEECKLKIEAIDDDLRGKLKSINEQISLNAHNISQLLQGKTKRNFSDNEDEIKKETQKLNEQYQENMKTISGDMKALKKENENIKKRLYEIENNSKRKGNGDIKNMVSEDNFESIEEIKQKVNSLESDLEKTMINVNNFKAEMNNNVHESFEKLKKEIDTEIFQMKMQQGHSIDSVPNSIRNLQHIEETLNSLPKRYADKIAFENLANKYKRNESKIENLDEYIIQVIERYFQQSGSQQNIFSERVVQSNDYVRESYVNTNSNKEMQEYKQGIITNKTNGYSLDGDRKHTEGEIDYFLGKEENEENVHHSKHNAIDMQDLPGFGTSHEKSKMNNNYNRMNPDDIIGNKNMFESNFLSQQLHPSKDEPIDLAVDYNKNTSRENENDNDQYGYQFGKDSTSMQNYPIDHGMKSNSLEDNNVRESNDNIWD